VSYDELSKHHLAATFFRGGLRVDRINDVALKRYGDLAPDGHHRPRLPEIGGHADSPQASVAELRSPALEKPC